MKPVSDKKLPYLLLAALVIGIVWWMLGRETAEPIPAFKDETAARTYLKSEVAAGNMTQIEAQVRLAEAISSIEKRNRKKGWQQAYAGKVKEIMEEKGISEEEAKGLLKERLKNKKGTGKAKPDAGKNKASDSPITK